MTAPVVSRFRFGPVLAAIVITVLLLMLLGRTADIFLLLFLAILISLYLNAVAALITRYARLPRIPAFLAAVGISLGLLVALVAIIVPPVIDQTQQLMRVLPDHISNWERGIDRFMTRVPALRAVWGQPGQHRVLLAVYQQLSGVFGDLVPKLVSVVHVAINLFSVAIMGLYLALHPGLYREWLIALFPPVHRDLVRNVTTDLATTLRRFIIGQMAAMLFLGALTAFLLYLLNVPYWVTFGVFTGVVSIVPFFGTLLSTLLPALFVLGGPAGEVRALLVVAAGIVVHLVEGNLVTPKIMQKQVHLPPVMTIMGVLIMGKLLGGVGLLVAVPTVAVIMVVIRRILINRLYEGQGFRKTLRDRAVTIRTPAEEGSVLLPSTPPPDLLALVETGAGGGST
ncbi:MAG: AI-2E family transporter [Gemmatimonadaceae bacterium]